MAMRLRDGQATLGQLSSIASVEHIIRAQRRRLLRLFQDLQEVLEPRIVPGRPARNWRMGYGDPIRLRAIRPCGPNGDREMTRSRVIDDGLASTAKPKGA